ncbi:succinate dehydrogenase assembly factor 2 [Thoreauomyces humboldtii]|nr:succinate dehydrogenase assembly factor 2 [Thoreauomyces humboldtii]
MAFSIRSLSAAARPLLCSRTTTLPTSSLPLPRLGSSPIRLSSSNLPPSDNTFPDWSRKPPSPSDASVDFLPSNLSIPRPHRPDEPTDVKRARLVWASRKRGILETDLLLSTFAQTHLPGLDREQLLEYDDFLEENDWDIYYWITEAEGRIVPDRIRRLAIFPRLVEHSKNRQRKILRMPELDLEK